jgi:hypothetical protein
VHRHVGVDVAAPRFRSIAESRGIPGETLLTRM